MGSPGTSGNVIKVFFSFFFLDFKAIIPFKAELHPSQVSTQQKNNSAKMQKNKKKKKKVSTKTRRNILAQR